MLNTKLKIISGAITAALLSACASGGSSSSTYFAPAPVVTTPGTNLTTQCAANTACTPDMSAFSATITFGANGNTTSVGTVTSLGATAGATALNTNGNPTSITLAGGVNTTVSAITANPDGSSIKGTAANGQHVELNPKGQTVPATIASPGAGLQYSNFGGWHMLPGDVGTVTITFGRFAGGRQFTMAMPTTGSATYAGRADGIALANNTPYGLSGDLNLTANFAASTINGSMTGMSATDNSNSNAAAGLFNDVTLAGTINGNAFSGTATAGALPAGVNPAAIAAGTVGTTSGHFYGPSANEVTGLWGMSSGGVQVIGAFGAKQ